MLSDEIEERCGTKEGPGYNNSDWIDLLRRVMELEADSYYWRKLKELPPCSGAVHIHGQFEWVVWGDNVPQDNYYGDTAEEAIDAYYKQVEKSD